MSSTVTVWGKSLFSAVQTHPLEKVETPCWDMVKTQTVYVMSAINSADTENFMAFVKQLQTNIDMSRCVKKHKELTSWTKTKDCRGSLVKFWLGLTV
jgi:hypothetical protein